MAKFYSLISFLFLLFQQTQEIHAQQPPGQTSITAVPAVYFDSLFTRHHAGEWTGGDIAYSRLLPDGRSFWLFGDAFTDTVYPDRHRPHDGFTHSVIVLTGLILFMLMDGDNNLTI